MLVTTKEMFEKARAGKYAVVAPDYYDNNSCRAFVRTAEEMGQPIIISYAEGFKDNLSLEEAALIGLYYAKTAKTPVALHLDHGNTIDFIKRAIDLGFTSVMIDASSDTFENNVAKTKEIVEYAHAKGVVVEAEIGHVGQGTTYVNEGVDDKTNGDSVYTTVEEAVEFVKQTNVDSLAVSIGTAHGKYKGTPVINFERLHELREAVSVPLVLHGGSSSGDENLERCATEGISKINVFTDFVTAALESSEKVPANSWVERVKNADKAMSGVLRHYFHVFHCDK